MFDQTPDPPTHHHAPPGSPGYPAPGSAPGSALGSTLGTGPGGNRGTAAVLVWVTAAVCIGFFGLCSLTMIALVAWQPPEFMSQIPADQHEAIMLGLPVMSACMMLFFVLPGIALAALGFGVRTGKRGPTVAAIVILWTLIGLLGLIILLNGAGALIGGDIMGLLVNLVVFGAVIALMVVTVLKLHAAASGGPSGPDPQTFEDEPWNSHLMG